MDTSETHLLEHTFKRRGILRQTVGLMSYLKHEEWRRHLFKAMRQEVVYAGESAPGLADILHADRRIWLMLGDATIDSGVQPRGGLKPLETALDEILESQTVNQILICRRRTQTRAAAPPPAAAAANKGRRSQGHSIRLSSRQGSKARAKHEEPDWEPQEK